MKNITYLPFLILVMALTVQSCQDEPEYPDLTWKETTTLSVAPSDSLSNFVIELDFATGEPREMITDTLNLNFDLDWTSDNNPVSKVTLYIQLQEDVDSIKTSYGMDTEIILAEITEFSAEGKFNLSITTDAVYDLFQDAFGGSRDQLNMLAIPGDLFEITWKLTGADGTVVDVRNDCFGLDCQYSIFVDSEFPFLWWAGTFDYEWIVLSGDVIYYGEIDVGTNGSIEFTPIGIGDKGEEYDISHTLFNYYFAPGDALGTLYFDESTGLVSIEGKMAEIWNISNVNGPSLDISFTYEWPDEWGTVTLTRTDGLDWPTNIHTEAR